jgi:hypothetical protein
MTRTESKENTTAKKPANGTRRPTPILPNGGREIG